MKQVSDFLLRLYPAEYQAMFADEIRSVLHKRREDHRKKGTFAFFVLGIREALGLLIGLAREWIAKLTIVETYLGEEDAVIAQQIAECEDRIRFVTSLIDNAIANHDFEGARFYSTEEEKERAKLKLLYAGLKDSKEGEL